MAQKHNKKARRTPAYSTDTMVVCMIFGFLFIALGVLIFLANALGMSGDVFDGLRTFTRGLCGIMAVGLAVIPVWGGIMLMISIQRKPPMRPFLLAILMLVLLCTTATLLTFKGSASTPLMNYVQQNLRASGIADTMPSYLPRGFTYGDRKSVV